MGKMEMQTTDTLDEIIDFISESIEQIHRNNKELALWNAGKALSILRGIE